MDLRGRRSHLYLQERYSTYLEAKAARIELQGNRDAKLAKRMEAELEWVRSSPKARQAENKGPSGSLRGDGGRGRASQKLDWIDIRIPVGRDRGAARCSRPITCTRFDGRVLIDDLSFTLPRNGIRGRHRPQRSP